MFSRRHELELGQIKALASELLRRVPAAEREIDAIRETQLRNASDRTEAGGAAVAEDGSEPLIAFVHIPKTAGGTVTAMFAAAYSKAALRDAGNYPKNPDYTMRKLARQKKQTGRITAGHVPYSVFREHLPPDARYVTFLRDPVDRVLSHYYRHIHRPGLSHAERTQRRQEGRQTAGSLEEALAEMRLPHLRNLATRFLCSDRSPMEELSPTALEDAKRNLLEFAFVGIQERFDESLVLLQRTFGLGLVPALNRHVSAEGRRPTAEEISAEERALIVQHNGLDLELHELASTLFDEAVAAAERNLADDVETLRGLSADVNQQAMDRAREWLDRELPVGTAREAAPLRAAAKAEGVPMTALKVLLKSAAVPELTDGAERIVIRTEERL